MSFLEKTLHVGLDIGSAAIKAVFVKDGRILWRGLAPTAPGQAIVAQKLIEDGYTQLGLESALPIMVVSTGYGKKLFQRADRNVDEITANAQGAFSLSEGKARTVINIGGQDMKVIIMNGDGRVVDFKMNDKCAAGTGRFFELVARVLDTPISDFDRLCASSTEEVEINSTCVVFAESEIISLLARGVRKEAILQALHVSIARRITGLLGRNLPQGAVFLDGGPAQNRALAAAIENELMAEVYVLNAPQYTVAYGAALV